MKTLFLKILFLIFAYITIALVRAGIAAIIWMCGGAEITDKLVGGGIFVVFLPFLIILFFRKYKKTFRKI